MEKMKGKSVLVADNTRSIYALYCSCGAVDEQDGVVSCCPICKKEPEVNLIENDYKRLSFLTKKEDDAMIVFTYEISEYRASSRNAAFKLDKTIFKIALDKVTGEGLMRSGKKLERLIGKKPPLGIFRDFIHNIRDDWESQLEIINTFLKTRGVIDLSPDEFYNDRFYKIFLFTTYPTLQLLGTSLIGFLSKDEKLIKVLQQVETKTELFSYLTGHKAKTIRKKAENVAVFNFLLTWGKLIKKPEHLIQFIDNIYLNDNREIFDRRIPRDEFNAGIYLIKSLHQNQSDNIWINRLIKSVKLIERDIPTNWEIVSYVEDIGRMFSQIRRRNKSYEVQFDGDIKNLHDNLSVDNDKARIQNHKINYTDKELTLEKIIDGTKEIILAPDTHYLVRVGSLMNICVGSYHQLATSKVCDIAVLKEGESPVVCLEIRGKELVQAKMKHNKRPNDEYRKEIIRWCLDNQLEYINCIDII